MDDRGRFGPSVFSKAVELSLSKFLQEMEAAYIEDKLKKSGGSIKQAAALSGVDQGLFGKKIKKHGIKTEIVEVRVYREH